MAKTINKVELLGRVGADPEMKYTQGGTAITQLQAGHRPSPPGRERRGGLALNYLLGQAWRGCQPVCRQRGPAVRRRQAGAELV